jgi:hypothetical protein
MTGKNFFKRKKVNPHTLYNTLVFITPCFDHREDDWEVFLKMIIKENEHRRPNYPRISLWFHDTFQKALNNSECKYFCRYVKMSSISKDRDSKLRDAMDNIDLPPIKYDSWVNEVFTLEYDETSDINESKTTHSSSRNYPKEALDKVVAAVAAVGSAIGALCQSIGTGKTHPDNDSNNPKLRKQLSNSKLTFSSRGNTRSRYNISKTNDLKMNTQASLTMDSSVNDTDEVESSDIIRKFSSPQPLLVAAAKDSF